MPNLIPCPTCNMTRTVTHEDRHAETRQDVCPTCAPYEDTHPGMVPARTGESPEASFGHRAETTGTAKVAPDLTEALRRFYGYGGGLFPDLQPPKVPTWGNAYVRMNNALMPFLGNGSTQASCEVVKFPKPTVVDSPIAVVPGKGVTSLEEGRQCMAEVFAGFVRDPPDSEFQDGYLAALYVIAVNVFGMDPGPEVPLPEPPKKPAPHLRLVALGAPLQSNKGVNDDGQA